MHGPPLDLSRSNPFYCNFQILTAKNSDLVEIVSNYSFSIFILFVQNLKIS